MGDIKIGKLTLGMCSTNCYFLFREGCPDTVVFDPADEGEYIFDKLNEKGFVVKAIVLTHGHFDHIYGVKGMKNKSHAKVYALSEAVDLLMDAHKNLSESVGRPEIVNPDETFRDGDEITLCDITFKVIHTPGHTKGSTCFYIPECKYLIAGDTLFCESIGRSDFPTGSERTLIESIKEKLLALPDETKVYPGHGGSTTIGYERENNPFIA